MNEVTAELNNVPDSHAQKATVIRPEPVILRNLGDTDVG